MTKRQSLCYVNAIELKNLFRFFKCQEGRALFIRPNQCSKDRRFEEVDTPNTSKFSSKQQTDTKMFGQVECPSVPGAVAPLSKCVLKLS